MSARSYWSCASCRFSSPAVMDGDDPPTPVLECLRFPPAVVPLGDDPAIVAVQVAGDDWCGEWVSGIPVVASDTEASAGGLRLAKKRARGRALRRLGQLYPAQLQSLYAEELRADAGAA